MAWLNKLNSGLGSKLSLTLSAVALASIAVSGCNVGKTDTVTATSGGTTTTTATKSGCTGSYIGSYDPPSHEERIRLRNLSLAGRGVAVTGNDDIDNANAGGGPPDGGIWMAGSYAFETDANCNVVAGQTLIFYTYQYDIGGTVGKDGTFKLTWSGQGSAGELFGKVDSSNNISGEFHHPAPDNFVYGVLNGRFTPNGKI
jgi:hypothetical protein